MEHYIKCTLAITGDSAESTSGNYTTRLYRRLIVQWGCSSIFPGLYPTGERDNLPVQRCWIYHDYRAFQFIGPTGERKEKKTLRLVERRRKNRLQRLTRPDRRTTTPRRNAKTDRERKKSVHTINEKNPFVQSTYVFFSN